MRNLSKSKIIAYRQCQKRLWLEIHKPELRDDSGSEMVFQIGYQVGDVARKIYDPENMGTLIDIEALGHGEALARSAVLLSEGRAPVFEAGMAAGGALAYADVMLPDISDGMLRWKMIEVKSSTSVKEYHRDDIAVQTYIAARAAPAKPPAIPHPDHAPAGASARRIESNCLDGGPCGTESERTEGVAIGCTRGPFGIVPAV